MVKEIIFDCFGVLTEDSWLAFLHKFGNEQNVEALNYANFQLDRGLSSFDQFIQEVSNIVNIPKEQSLQIILKPHQPNQSLFELIKKLKYQGYRLGIISNVSENLSHYLPKEYLKLFDTITLSFEAGFIKPQPEIFELHLEKTKLEAKQSIFIDDREINCDGARHAGMQAILYESVAKLKKELQKFDVIF